ncbi:MarR family winged helix-turn-helix transcriptional regulator [Caulobacter soli]|uniref:MarR family winged helix-turn-helix transcriptional regulator n=1 Tax=Caulobacter soli TaxID=2708539 RepID=UPI0013E9F05E|nr:MarR family transcriptional regulator [Caulobacter soli]
MTLPPRLLDERTFAGSLLRLARIYRREVNRILVEHHLSDARALPVLYIARSGGGMRQGHLAEELGVEGPSLVRVLDQLCAAGLVERRDDPKDGRAKTLHLTPEGDALAVIIEDAIQDLRTRFLADVSTEDLAAAVRVFTVFEAALEAAASASGQEG